MTLQSGTTCAATWVTTACPSVSPLACAGEDGLRYGENPHQRAALYRLPHTPPGSLIDATQHQGKPLSYNNLADADAALECVKSFDTPACVIVKHANPCGVGLDERLARKPTRRPTRRIQPRPSAASSPAIADSGRATGCEAIVARQFLEVIVAPGFTAAAFRAYPARHNVRVLDTGALSPTPAGLRLQAIEGGHAGAGQGHRATESSRTCAWRRRRSARGGRAGRCAAGLERGAIRKIQRHRLLPRERARSASAPAR